MRRKGKERELIDLDGLLIRTLTDLQVMKETYEQGFRVYNKIVDAVETFSESEVESAMNSEEGAESMRQLVNPEEVEQARSLVTTGFQVHEALQNFIKSTLEAEPPDDLEDGDESKTDGQFEMEYSSLEAKAEPVVKLEDDFGYLENIKVEGEETEDEYKESFIKINNENLPASVDERGYSCDLCEKSFKQRGHLTEHRNTIHSDKRPFKCDMCNKTFKRKSQMNYHLRLVHECKTCGKQFASRADRKQHKTCEAVKLEGEGFDPMDDDEEKDALLKSETSENENKVIQNSVDGKKYACDFCGKGFNFQSQLNEHKNSTHSKLRPYKCDICHKTFKTKSQINFHQRNIHECKNCGEKFASRADKKMHKICTTVVRSNGSDRDEDEENKLVTNLDADNNLTNIDDIDKSDMNFEEFGNEEKLKLEKDPTSGNLLKNEDADIGVPKPPKPKVKKNHLCDMCPKRFKSPGDLQDHKIFRHSDSDMFKCELCDRNFHKKYWKHHMKFAHKCDFCDENFATLPDKRQHLYKVHPGLTVTPESKKVVCDWCGIKIIKGNLKRHMLQHTGEKPFTCDICNKSFTQLLNLKHHLFLHTGEKPFECDVCKRKFRNKEQLRTHYRLHTGEKPFECDVCGKAFHLGGERNKHMKKFHGATRLQNQPTMLKTENK